MLYEMVTLKQLLAIGVPFKIFITENLSVRCTVEYVLVGLN